MQDARCLKVKWMCMYTSVKEKEMSSYEDEPGRAVGIATRYGLDGSGIDSRWRRDFQHPSIPAPVAPSSPLFTGYLVSFPGVQRPVLHHSPPSSAEVKEGVELYICSPSVIGRTSAVLARWQSCKKRQLRHVCPSVRMEQLGFHWMVFREVWYLSILKSVEKIQV